jgi:hypothetical protein
MGLLQRPEAQSRVDGIAQAATPKSPAGAWLLAAANKLHNLVAIPGRDTRL